MKYKRALVTGGAGFIGSHVVSRLVDMGIETVVIDDLSMGRRQNVSKKAKLIVADILDYRALKRASEGADVILHNAAKVSIRNSFKELYADANVNIVGTVNVLRAMAENKIKKVIYASSMAVYGKNPLPIPETGIIDPISPYGIAKLASERYCLLMGKINHFDVVILRYFNTYGRRQTLTPYVGVITIFVHRLLRGKPPVVFGSGDQRRDFIYVDDIVEANILSMKENIKSEIFNVGTGTGTTVSQIARLLIDRINPDIEPKHAAMVPGEPASSVADIKKAKKLMGFIARFKLEDKIDEVIDWIRLHNGNTSRCPM